MSNDNWVIAFNPGTIPAKCPAGGPLVCQSCKMRHKQGGCNYPYRYADQKPSGAQLYFRGGLK